MQTVRDLMCSIVELNAALLHVWSSATERRGQLQQVASREARRRRPPANITPSTSSTASIINYST